jgi:hypothetical protein
MGAPVQDVPAVPSPDSGVFLSRHAVRLLRHLESFLRELSEVTIRGLAERMLGSEAVRVLPTLPGRAALATAEDRWVVYIRPDLSESEQEEAIAHELAEWVIQVGGTRYGDPEATARHIAARLLAYSTRAA